MKATRNMNALNAESLAREHLERLLGSKELRAELIKRADRVGQPLTRQAITDWRNLRGGIPAARVPLVAKILRVPQYELRPDLPTLFPHPRRNNHRVKS